MGANNPPPIITGATLIYELLRRPQGWAIKDIAARFSVTDRAVRNYIQLLREEFPGWRDRHGESRIQKTRIQGRTVVLLRWDKVDASVRETRSILGALAAAHFSTQLFGFLKGTPLGTALRATGEAFQAQLRATHPGFGTVLQDAGRMFYIVPDAPKSYEKKAEVLEKLIHTIAFRQQIRMKYDAASSGRGWRDLQPLTLLSYRSALYLIGRAPGETKVKTFAVDRIMNITPSVDRTSKHPITFSYPPLREYDPATLIDGSFGIFQDPQVDDASEVVVRFATDQHTWLRPSITERQWHPSQRFEDDDAGRLIMSFKVRGLSDVQRWVLGYGDMVEVLAPADLVAMHCPPTSIESGG